MKTNLKQTLIAFILLLTISPLTFAATLQEVIADAVQRFQGVAFTAERYQRPRGPFYDVELLVGRRIVEAVYNADTGALVSSEIYSAPRRWQRVSAALGRADISLSQAIGIAETRVPDSRAIDAEILLRGNRYEVYVLAGNFRFEVFIDSKSGRVVRVERYPRRAS